MKACIVGTGRAVPQHCYDNAFMRAFVGAPEKWNATHIERLLGIHERRFSRPLNNNTGRPAARPANQIDEELDMAAEAATNALEAAGRDPKDIDLLVFVSCTSQSGSRLHFSRSAFDLHLRLGLPAHARVHEMDAGCGGALHALEMAWEILSSGRRKTALIVASSNPSQYMNRDYYLKHDAWLSPLIFGDGASAIVLARGSNGAGLLDSVTSVDPGVPLMALLGNPKEDPELAYWIDAKRVKEAFGLYAKSALEALRARVPEVQNADCYIFHQVNARVLRDFTDSIGLPPEKVPVNVDVRGNIAAAATFDILDAEIRAGRLDKNALVVICAVGAGAQSGALAVRL